MPTTCNRPASALVLVAADHRQTLDKGIRSVLAHLGPRPSVGPRRRDSGRRQGLMHADTTAG
jgi:hypothetical protein